LKGIKILDFRFLKEALAVKICLTGAVKNFKNRENRSVLIVAL